MFLDPLTDQDLYWIGYIRADGGLYQARNRNENTGYLAFGQKYKEPVEALRSYVGGEGKIHQRTGETNFGPTSLHHFASTKPFLRLKELGVKTDLRPDIYEQPAFWRGLLDGDGSVGTVKNRGLIYPTVVWSGRLEDMEKCSEWVAKTLNRKAPKVGTARSIFRVGLVGTPAFNLIKLLYENQYSALPYKVEAAAKALEWKIKHEKMVRNA